MSLYQVSPLRGFIKSLDTESLRTAHAQTELMNRYTKSNTVSVLWWWWCLLCCFAGMVSVGRSVGPNVLLSVFPSVVHKEVSMNIVWFNHANQPIKMQLVLRMLQAL
jgi:hypothetical protein